MRVKPTRIKQESAVRVDLPDGMPVMRASLYSNNSRMRPRAVTISWMQLSSNWHCRVLIEGVSIRKDGTEGTQSQAISYIIPEWHPSESELRADEHPDWLDDLVDRYTPPMPELEVERVITLKTVTIPIPQVLPFGLEVDMPEYVQEVWDVFVKPDQDAEIPPSVEMRLLMAILRAVYAGLYNLKDGV